MPFIGKQSTSNSQITNYTTTVGSGGQTNFTVVIEGGDETHVYLNGVLLKETTDYTVSSTQVSLVSAAVENDIVEIKVFRSFALVDAVRASDGGTFSGDVTVPNLIIGDGGNIGSASDTDAIAIASDGGLTFSGGIDNAGTISAGTIGSGVAGFTGIKNAQEWRLQTAHTTTANNVSMMNNWSRTGPLIGTALTYSPASANDRFEFPETGIWNIDFQCNGSVGTNGSYLQFIIYWCTDGSTFDKNARATAYFDDATQTDGSQLYLRNSFLLDVTDTSQVFFKVHQGSNSTNAQFIADGGTDQFSATSIRVTRLGDT